MTLKSCELSWNREVTGDQAPVGKSVSDRKKFWFIASIWNQQEGRLQTLLFADLLNAPSIGETTWSNKYFLFIYIHTCACIYTNAISSRDCMCIYRHIWCWLDKDLPWKRVVGKKAGGVTNSYNLGRQETPGWRLISHHLQHWLLTHVIQIPVSTSTRIPSCQVLCKHRASIPKKAVFLIKENRTGWCRRKEEAKWKKPRTSSSQHTVACWAPYHLQGSQ